MADVGADGDPVGQEIEAELHDAICAVLQRHGMMATKWLAGVKIIGEDGERTLGTFTSPDFRSWDSIGILGCLDARERGVVGAEAADERLDEDDGG